MTMRRTRPLLELRHAAFRLGPRLVLTDSNWTLRRGEHWAIVGGTGAGKTLLCRALCGDLPLVRGTLDYHFPAPPRREPETAIAYVSAEQWSHDPVEGAPIRWFSLDRELSPLVRDQLSWRNVENINPFEVVRRRAADSARWQRRARRVIRWLDIEPLLPKPMLALSNGERRKVALARALLRAPRILILDDPFAGLDTRYRRHLRQLLARLITQRATTLLLVGAQPADWPRGLTHLLHMDRLRIAAQGPLAPLKRALRAAGALPAAMPTVPRHAAQSAALGTELIRLTDVAVRWNDTPLLEHVNWTVRAGESWALLGPNGSGKSTLLSYIIGDNPQVYANDVRVFGHARGSGESLWDIQRHIGWVSPELHAGFDGTLTGLATVMSGFFAATPFARKFTPRQHAAARDALRRLRLMRLADAPFAAQSTGEQRLLLLARALVTKPSLLILDEPCQGLDHAHRARLLAIVDQQIRRGTTVLFVTHRRDEIPPAIRRVLRLRHGRAVAGVL